MSGLIQVLSLAANIAAVALVIYGLLLAVDRRK